MDENKHEGSVETKVTFSRENDLLSLCLFTCKLLKFEIIHA
jgi:hypothetical protein